MAAITISSKDAERLAKSFADLIGAKGLDRIRRKAVNEVGATARKQLRIVGPAVYRTSAAALAVQGKAAAPGSDNPAYRLRFAAKIPVARLKASNRKVTRAQGRKALAITLPGGDVIRFRSIHRDGARFRLLRAGPLVERGLGGVYTNARTAFERYDELKPIRRDAERQLPEAVARAVDEFMKRRRR